MSSEIHLLKGSDPVLLNDAVVELIDRLVGDSARDEVLAEFSGDDYDLGAVVLASQTISMFGDRVVVARNLGRFGTGKNGRKNARIAILGGSTGGSGTKKCGKQ